MLNRLGSNHLVIRALVYTGKAGDQFSRNERHLHIQVFCWQEHRGLVSQARRSPLRLLGGCKINRAGDGELSAVRLPSVVYHPGRQFGHFKRTKQREEKESSGTWIENNSGPAMRTEIRTPVL